MISATQTAVNGRLGKIINSPIKAAIVSFTVGMICLFIIFVILKIKNAKKAAASAKEVTDKAPWWIWIGGVLGGLYVVVNVHVMKIIGTGMTVIIFLLGTTASGVLVDNFGLFQSPKKPINLQKIIGLVIMIIGTALIKLM